LQIAPMIDKTPNRTDRVKSERRGLAKSDRFYQSVNVRVAVSPRGKVSGTIAMETKRSSARLGRRAI